MREANAYTAPAVETLTTAVILESLGPVSAYTGIGQPTGKPCKDVTQLVCDTKF